MWFALIMLGNVAWSVSDVMMSMVMNRVDEEPIVVSWYVAVVEMIALLLLALFFPVERVWVGMFALGAAFAYVGLLSMGRLLQRVDVSVSSAAWVFLSIGIAIGGMVLFGEVWTPLQTLGALLSVFGVLLLAFWHHHGGLVRTCGLLSLVGLAYVPYFLIQKAALLDGVPLFTVFFWPPLIQKIFALVVPLLLPSYRQRILRRQIVDTWFASMTVLWVLMSLLGILLVTMAYDQGDASLVGMAENGQPFFLMAFAWLAIRLFPESAPRELLTSQSISVKLVSFVIVFVGLGLLAFS